MVVIALSLSSKKVIMLLLLSVLLTLVFAANVEIGQNKFEKVKYANNILEERFSGIMTSLRSIAKSYSDGISVQWEKIKKPLSLVEKQYKGLSLLILPDGNYYSGTRNFTGLNLKNREYFLPLMNGEEVYGYPVFSKSTGKKSLVFAVPVFFGEKVIAAVGFTCYLDIVNSWIEKKAIISDDCEFYVLEPNGKIIISNDYSYLFEEMDFVAEGINDNMSVYRGESGFYAYIEEKEERVISYSISENGFISLISEKEASEINHAKLFLMKVQRKIGDIMIDLDWNLENASRQIDENTTEEEILNILSELQHKSEYIIDTSFIDKEGYIRYIVPEEYSGYKDEYVGDQEHIVKLRQTGYPVMSDVFTSVEGFDSIDIEWPVYSSKGEYIGSLSYLIKPIIFLENILSSIKHSTYEFWLMNVYGRIIFDKDEYEIGQNLFEEGIYSEFPELVELGKQMVKQRFGEGNYEFFLEGSEEINNKKVIWTTIGLHDTFFRLLLSFKN